MDEANTLRDSNSHGPPGLVQKEVNDVIHGRKAAEELLRTALAPFGLQPLWPSMTINVGGL